MDSRRLRDALRAQSPVVGVVLIIGMTLAAASAVVVFGGDVIDDGRQESQIGQAEQAMTQFDSRASQVALGESDVQTVRVGQNGGQYRVDPDRGRLVLIHENRTGTPSEEEIYNGTLGAFVYERGGTQIAYQGGGVWRSQDGSSTMISPPEFHYRSGTLTLPIVKTNGSGSAGGQVQAEVRKRGESKQLFPNSSTEYDNSSIPYQNPLPNGSVYVEVQSQYCDGWQSYFESRTEGGIAESCSDNREDTVRLELNVPFEGTFDNNIVVSSSLEVSGGGDTPDFKKTLLPSVSENVDQEIDDCKSGGCTDLSSALGSTVTNGTYYENGDVTLDGETFDTSSKNISLVVDGDVTIKGDNDILGSGNVKLFLKGEYDLQGSINEGGDATRMQVYVHSSADQVTHGGSTHFTGIIYAPNTELVQQGSGVLRGAVFADVVDVKGNPSSTFEVDPSLEDYRLKLVSGDVPITFLHVTENELGIDLE